MSYRAALTLAFVAFHAMVTYDCEAIEMPGFLKKLTKPHEGDVAPPPANTDLGQAPGGGFQDNTAPPERSTRGTRRESSAPPNATGSTEDTVRIQEVQRGPGKASVVLDKHCKRIVQSYSVADNVASVGVFAGTESLKSLPNQFSDRAPKRNDPDIVGSAKHAAKQMNWLPMSAEVLYGERAHDQETDVLERDSKLGRKFYPIADKLLSDVLAGVNERHDYKFRIFILKNPGRNALARPGGFIYVDQGLIDNPAQHPKAYFAVAHEIAHVLQRHETKELQSMIVDSLQTKHDIVKVMSGVRGNPAIILDHLKVQKNLFTQHHVDQELQADSCAARALSRVFPDANQLATSLQAFLKDLPKVAEISTKQQSRNDLEKIGDTAESLVKDPVRRHPTSQQRYDNLRTMYREVVSASAKPR